ncbi:hypothetical protein SDC9_95063 [bioreactor metagenome]|uniref:DUF3892 domain-containing protein n=1 Tax=bioreactor metagenome TaxID=1076179 RepID=A0A645A575_9ZZZZ|nr:DUF3892 domain-containing protein [Clostridium sp. BSD9I1]MBE6067254.1 DUF3892 domain-containing protein [Clostridium lundense]
MKIIKIRKNNDGDITNVLTDDNIQRSLTEAVALAKRGKLDSVIVEKNQNGVNTIASSPKSNDENNLNNLPTF